MNAVRFSWKYGMVFICCLVLLGLGTVLRAETETAGPGSSSGLWEQMKDAAGTATERVTETVKKKINDANYTFAEVQEWTTEKVQQLLETFAGYRPVIKEAGFEAGEIAVEVGLMPKLVVTFDRLRNISEARQQALLEKHREDKVLTFMLESLFKAYSLQLDTYTIKKTRVYLTIPPKTLIILDSAPEEREPAEEQPAEDGGSLY